LTAIPSRGGKIYNKRKQRRVSESDKQKAAGKKERKQKEKKVEPKDPQVEAKKEIKAKK
jgi:hypothetical protein